MKMFVFSNIAASPFYGVISQIVLMVVPLIRSKRKYVVDASRRNPCCVALSVIVITNLLSSASTLKRVAPNIVPVIFLPRSPFYSAVHSLHDAPWL